jgi:hypothetical protein
MDPSRSLLLACATVIEDLQSLLPPGMQSRVFDFGLHVNPSRLREKLQQVIDAQGEEVETILLGYGMCSQALVGIRAHGCRLVAPRVDDCIALFLGSAAAYREQCRREPGTYYLTKGWIKAGNTPFSDFARTVEKFGREKAEMIYQQVMGRYKRLVFINTSHHELEACRQYVRSTAGAFNLQFEEIEGSSRLVRKLLAGEWDNEFVVLEREETFTLDHFLPLLEGRA